MFHNVLSRFARPLAVSVVLTLLSASFSAQATPDRRDNETPAHAPTAIGFETRPGDDQPPSWAAGVDLLSQYRLPRLSDGWITVQSMADYIQKLKALPKGVCLTLWLAASDNDAAYCLSLTASGDHQRRLLRHAAHLEHPIALNDLGHLLLDEPGDTSTEEIVDLIRAAAHRTIPHARVTLGWWMMTGEMGLPIDYDLALTLNEWAYDQGHSEGANNVGEIHERGLGVPANRKSAISWYAEAARMGNREARERLDRLTGTIRSSASGKTLRIRFPGGAR